MLRDGCLNQLFVTAEFEDFPPEGFVDSTQELAAAVRSCKELEVALTVEWDNANHPEMVALLQAFAGCRELDLSDTRIAPDNLVEAGQALGELLAANDASMKSLDVSGCHLGNSGIALVLAGLASNTHLDTLECSDNDGTDEFQRKLLEPALAALAARRGARPP